MLLKLRYENVSYSHRLLSLPQNSLPTLDAAVELWVWSSMAQHLFSTTVTGAAQLTRLCYFYILSGVECGEGNPSAQWDQARAEVAR